MVLQRDMPCAIFGSGDPGKTIVISLNDADGNVVKTEHARVGSNQKWSLKLSPTPAGGPNTLTVGDGTDLKSINDVHFGEVWLMSGQSNMANPIGKERNAPLVEGDEYPTIRIYHQSLGWLTVNHFNVQYAYAQGSFFSPEPSTGRKTGKFPSGSIPARFPRQPLTSGWIR